MAKNYMKKWKEKRAESKAFKNIVGKRTLQARRQTYEEEAIRQARLTGQRMAIERANAPLIRREKARAFGRGVSAFIIAKATQKPVRRVAPVKRRKARTRYSYAPVRRRRRTVRYVYAPVRRRRKVRYVYA